MRATIVCVACYVGSAFDQSVVFPRIGTAILFPPYAILTAALLLSRVQDWWIYFLAAAIGNYLPHRTESPASWVLMAELANFVRALMAAGGIRYIIRGGPCFESVRGVVTFLALAVVVGPLAAAFIGAGVVQAHLNSADYWVAWQAWFLSNALTALTLLPIIVIGLRKGNSWLRGLTWGRGVEVGGLSFGLLTLGFLVFAEPYSGTSSLPARLYAPLPFLLWSAVRFGPGGVSASLLAITALTIWGALHEYGPFVTHLPDDNLLSLQLFLVAVSVPLMFLTAIMEERRHAYAALSAAEQELRSQYAQLATIYRAAPIGLAFVDRDLRFVGINDCLAEINGVTAEAHLGRTIREALPHLAHAIEPLYRRVLETGEPILNVEVRSLIASRPEIERTWLVSRYPVKDECGTPLGVSTVALETTERRQIEEARQELAHASRLALLGELTASVAHEINQPLGAILNNTDAAELLLESMPGSLDEVRRILDDIRKDDIRASEVIKRMRTLLRKRELQWQMLDLNDVILEVLTIIRAESGRRGVSVETNLASELPVVRGDKVHLQQVLLNLVLNGMDAMSDVVGARRLVVRSDANHGGAVEVAVSDTGQGIPAVRIGRLFTPFFSTKQDGLGLGLSIARSLVEVHGGRIWAENNASGGATLRFTLPTDAQLGLDSSPVEHPSAELTVRCKGP